MRACSSSVNSTRLTSGKGGGVGGGGGNAVNTMVESGLSGVEFIASNISTNIRELEGALIRVTAYASLSGEPITTELAQQQLADAQKKMQSAAKQLQQGQQALVAA